jgi:tetratricopeptide (TPR) repeat protein
MTIQSLRSVLADTGLEVEFFDRSTFLVVDDFQGMRSMLSALIRNCGGRFVDSAANGKDALTLLSQKRYDVILCDLNLGHGKSGQDVLEEARLKNWIGPSSCWIMITAEKSLDAFMGAAEIQPDAYLLKPITETKLAKRLEKILSRKRAFADVDQAIAEKNFLKAIRLCETRAREDRVNAVELLRVKSELLMDAGEFERARQSYEAALAAKDLPWARLGLARTYFQTKDYTRAKEVLEKLIAANRSYIEAYDWLARCHLALEDKEGAQEVLSRALSLSPNSHKRQQTLGDVALQQGKLEVAERAFRKSVSLLENSALKTPDPYLGLARAVSAQSNIMEAIRVLQKTAKTFTDEDAKIRTKTVEGLVYHENGKKELAKKSVEQLSDLLEATTLKIDSKNACEMASLMLATGEKEKALALLQSEVMNNPEDTDVIDSVREILHQAGLEEEADIVVDQTRADAVLLMNEGVLLFREGKFKEALASMREARRKMSKNVRLLFNSAYILIEHMKRHGSDTALVAEARSCLMDAHPLALGDPRFARMIAALDKIAGS